MEAKMSAHSIAQTKSISHAQAQPVLKPMGLGLSLLYFGLPMLMFALSVYLMIPFLVSQGYSPFVSYSASLIVPLGVIFAFSLGLYKQDGYPLTWKALAERFRLRRMSGKDWQWALVSLVIMFITSGILLFATHGLFIQGVVKLPYAVPLAIDPTVGQTAADFSRLYGADATGNWGLLLLSIILLAFNIVGEEFWWRGYIFPRQELVFGKRTWLVHGILWCLFHAFKWWEWIALLPVTLILSYVAQRRQSTWPGIVTHLIFNGLSLIAIVGVVMGAL
jgi:membrane protease YdiL (CAAX protease family)